MGCSAGRRSNVGKALGTAGRVGSILVLTQAKQHAHKALARAEPVVIINTLQSGAQVLMTYSKGLLSNALPRIEVGRPAGPAPNG
jgi:hypothetical protein